MSTIARKQKLFYSLLVVLVVVLAALVYFVTTGRKPTEVIPAPSLGKPTYLFSIYGGGKDGRLQKPLGVAVNADNVYVADSLNGRVAVFDLRGQPLFTFKKIKDGTLKNPSYLAVNPKDNTLYVSDTGLGAIFIFDSQGKFLRQFLPNNNSKFPWVPLGMTFDENGNLYVVDKGLNRVVKFNSKGKRLLSFGKSGLVKNTNEKPGSMYFPNALAVDSAGDIYVSDGNNQRIQIFNKGGKFKKIISVKGLPRGIGVVESGASAGIYVVNVFDHQVQVFNRSGSALFTFGELGQGEGQFRYPNDLAISKNRLFIADRENDRIQVWRF
jgi:DNA-binding beta-propeller fold protein YncE